MRIYSMKELATLNYKVEDHEPLIIVHNWPLLISFSALLLSIITFFGWQGLLILILHEVVTFIREDNHDN